jgi:hypothetical protein
MVLNAEDWLYIPVRKVKVPCQHTRSACSLQLIAYHWDQEYNQYKQETKFHMTRKHRSARGPLRQSKRLAEISQRSTRGSYVSRPDAATDAPDAPTFSSASNSELPASPSTIPTSRGTGSVPQTSLPISSGNLSRRSHYLLDPEQPPKSVVQSFASLPTHDELMRTIEGLATPKDAWAEEFWQPFQEKIHYSYRQYMAAERKLEEAFKEPTIDLCNDMTYKFSLDETTKKLAREAIKAWYDFADQIVGASREADKVLQGMHDRDEADSQGAKVLRHHSCSWSMTGSMGRHGLLELLRRIGVFGIQADPRHPLWLKQQAGPRQPVLDAPTQS